MNKIVFTGDVLRPKHQRLNIRWFYHLLSYPVARAIRDASIEMVVWDAKLGCFDAARVYELNGMEVSEENWARLFDAPHLSHDSIEYMRGFFEGRLIIGFELPDVFLRLFPRMGSDYLDFTIHPARFLDDIFFGIRTNIPEAFEVLKEHALSDEVLYLQAHIHKATISRMEQPAMPENSALFVGQTRTDKTLIREGRFIAPEDFIRDILEIRQRHSKLYYKRHPLAEPDLEWMDRLRAIPGVELIEENTYKLLCHEHIAEVYGISSSVLYEAKFFGKKATYLYRNMLPLWRPEHADFDPWVYIPVYNAFFSPGFWAKLLGKRYPVRACPDIALPAKTSRLRTSIQIHWGYNFLDYEILLKNIRGEHL